MFWAGFATGGILVAIVAFIWWGVKSYEVFNAGFAEGKVEGVEIGQQQISMAQYDRGFEAGGKAANRNRGLKAAQTKKAKQEQRNVVV
jgi:hypothetical protein